MFKRLQEKWQVSAKQFWIIFIAFGFTGTTTAYITRMITEWFGMGEQTWWFWKVLLKIFMLLIGYQVLLLFFGAIFGQWKFFWSYEKKLLHKLGILKKEIQNQQSKVRLAIFASGAGTNAKKIIEHFSTHTTIDVCLIVCNKPQAGVLQIAAENNIPTLIIEKEQFFRGNAYVDELKSFDIDYIILAGFLWKIPDTLIHAYPNNIINIHPALLPKYGGKGMYGQFVHQAVIEAGEKESGITIHYVDGHYDNGDIIFQAKCEVKEGDTAETLAARIHQLEHTYFPKVIEDVVSKPAKS